MSFTNDRVADDRHVEREAFDRAFDRLQAHEGGDRWSDHPDDEGGVTRWGISSNEWPAVDLKNMTEFKARDFFWNKYWRLYDVWDRCFRQPEIAALYFGLLVNAGPRVATMTYQRALNSVTASRHVVDDGRWGRNTAFVGRLVLTDPIMARAFGVAFRSETAGYYRMLAAIRPTQQVFLDGWLNRAYEL